MVIFNEPAARIAGRFGRVEPRRAAPAGLIGPQGLQQAEVVRAFVAAGPGSVGVQRRCDGTAGRIENCHTGVFLVYATPRGRALLDRRLYLPPHDQLADPDRCQAVGVPDEIAFATKPAFATAMVSAALGAGVPASWRLAVSATGLSGQGPYPEVGHGCRRAWCMPVRLGTQVHFPAPGAEWLHEAVMGSSRDCAAWPGSDGRTLRPHWCSCWRPRPLTEAAGPWPRLSPGMRASYRSGSRGLPGASGRRPSATIRAVVCVAAGGRTHGACRTPTPARAQAGACPWLPPGRSPPRR
ncbi:transposase [Nonomuraea sp. NPDC050451]|uniref:transposase n=1 Tax=Nonomuraea sp. NPDC050451 TaxID=3364364 RepID=UPI0037A54DA7